MSNIKQLIPILAFTGIFLMLIFWIIKLFSAKSAQSRIERFSLDNNSINNNFSLADTFLSFILKIVKSIANLLKKSSVFSSYSKRFEKSLAYIGNNNVDGLDFIAIKFLVMILIQLLYLISSLLKAFAFNIFAFIIASLIAFFLIDIIILILYNQKKKLLEEQLLQAIVIMNSAFKSGKNILQAMSIVKDELPAPINEEFELIYKDLKFGLALDVAFDRFYNRVKLEEAKYITSSLTLLSKTGGSIVTVFEMIEKNFYDRLKIKNELSAMTSQSKFLYRLLIALPIIFTVVIIIINPEYFNPLFTSTIGIIICVLIVLLYVFYIMIVKSVMKVERV